MEKKVTKKEMFKKVVEMATRLGEEDIAIFANHEIELLENKKTAPTATQKANVELKDKIVEVLATCPNPVTVTELLGTQDLQGFTNQKISALLSQLVKENKVVRTSDKKKAFFTIA